MDNSVKIDGTASSMTTRSKLRSLAAVALTAVIIVFLLPPIPQDPSYHQFADQRVLFHIPNFWNVVSNVPFIIVGIVGVISVSSSAPGGRLNSRRAMYLVFFVGVFLIGIGSSYYHWKPSNETLVWDRLPMTIAFMAFFCVIISENIDSDTGRALLWPLVLVGLLSVVYWHVTESTGQGDLRPYALVQFLPILIIPLVLCLSRSPYSRNLYVWLVIGTFALAKIAEHFDRAVFDGLGFISGHSIKHVAAAAGAYFFYVAVMHRSFVRQGRTGIVHDRRER